MRVVCSSSREGLRGTSNKDCSTSSSSSKLDLARRGTNKARIQRKRSEARVETKALDFPNGGVISENNNKNNNSKRNNSNRTWEGCSCCSYGCERPQDCVHACLNVGPFHSADQEDVESLYKQAKEAYHSGSPILSDDVFDSLESQLRYQRSELVSKGPRCSLRGLNIYSDAELDKSQTFLLASFWTVLSLSSYSFAAANLDGLLHAKVFDSLSAFVGLGLFTAFVKCLMNVLKGNEVAVKGECPNCKEEVYAFAAFNTVEEEDCEVESTCHMCRRPLIFKITKHKGIIRPMASGEWAYGKIFSKNIASDYSPHSK